MPWSDVCSLLSSVFSRGFCPIFCPFVREEYASASSCGPDCARVRTCSLHHGARCMCEFVGRWPCKTRPGADLLFTSSSYTCWTSMDLGLAFCSETSGESDNTNYCNATEEDSMEVGNSNRRHARALRDRNKLHVHFGHRPFCVLRHVSHVRFSPLRLAELMMLTPLTLCDWLRQRLARI